MPAGETPPLFESVMLIALSPCSSLFVIQVTNKWRPAQKMEKHGPSSSRANKKLLSERGNIFDDAFGKLLVVKACIEAAQCQQLLVGAAFYDLTLVNHQDYISGQDRREAVGDSQGSAMLHQRFERCL